MHDPTYRPFREPTPEERRKHTRDELRTRYAGLLVSTGITLGDNGLPYEELMNEATKAADADLAAREGG